VRDTEEIFELINDIKKIFKNINSYIPVYFDVGAGIRNIKFSEKYEISAERAGRETVTNIKNSVHP
jgi:hypothetical protein